MKLVIPPPVLAMIATGVIWVLDNQLPGLRFALPFQKILALSLASAGFIIAGIAAGGFFKKKTTVNPHTPSKTSALVTDGIYKFSRNPMYLGLLFILAAWSFWLGNISALGVIIAFVVYMTIFQIKPEEEALLEIFGDDYRAYCKKTRRWI